MPGTIHIKRVQPPKRIGVVLHARTSGRVGGSVFSKQQKAAEHDATVAAPNPYVAHSSFDAPQRVVVVSVPSHPLVVTPYQAPIAYSGTFVPTMLALLFIAWALCELIYRWIRRWLDD